MLNIQDEFWGVCQVFPVKDTVGIAKVWASRQVTSGGVRSLVFWRGSFWSWDEGKRLWTALAGKDFRVDLMMKLGGCYWETGEREVPLKPIKLNGQKVGEIVDVLERLCQIDDEKMVQWLGAEPCPVQNPEYTVAFEDVLVDVKASTDANRPSPDDLGGGAAHNGGVWVTHPRDARWFCGNVLRVKWNPEAQCPAWVKFMGEVSEGDKDWIECAERFAGWCCVASRREAKMLWQAGKVRGGKGVQTRVMKRIMGNGAMPSRDVRSLAGEFGMQGIEHAWAVELTEVGEVFWEKAEALASRVKSMAGQDYQTLNRKYQAPLQFRSGAAVIMQSNEVVRMPDKGLGLSSKVILQPYWVSFLGKEDLDLEDRLVGEGEGVAVRWVWALRRGLGVGAKWPESHRAKKEWGKYMAANAWWEQFLQDRFEELREGVITNEEFRGEYREWCKDMEMEMPVSEQNVIKVVIEKASWVLGRARHMGGPRMVTGLCLKGTREEQILAAAKVERMEIEEDEFEFEEER